MKVLIKLTDLNPPTKANVQYHLDKLKQINPPLEIEVCSIIEEE